MTTASPTPESFLKLIHRSRRGRLKVYLGYGPGVGKTYQLLLEGQRLKVQGVDVVAGYIETHGRAETESLCLGLEVLPRRSLVYRGVKLDEMDLPAILERRPEVVLIDELAHTNVPGSGNVKRYQDVQDVLAAGIHVITTVNVQHLESLYDTVERLIGVRVKERVPDWVIAEADEIVNVDLGAEDLQRRLAEGKVYTPERADQALAHFFRKANLEQLRELALREAASVLERKGRGLPDEEQVQAPDQLVLCLSAKSPESPALLRYASRLAGRLNRNWYALYVQTPAENPLHLDAATKSALAESLTLAGQLGAMVFTFKGDDVVDTLLRFAREYRVGHLVVGRPAPRPFWQRFRRHEGLDLPRLLAEARGMAVVVVDASPEGATGENAANAAASAPPEAPRGFGTRLEERPEPKPVARPLAAATAPLSTYLNESTILVFPQPVGKSDLLARLVSAVAGGFPVDAADILRRVERREAEASTFLSEGIALPHVRVPGLAAARMGLALPRAELAGSGIAGIEAVFLFLCPEEAPDLCLGLLAKAARLFRDPTSRTALKQAKDAGEVLAVLREWEAGLG